MATNIVMCWSVNNLVVGQNQWYAKVLKQVEGTMNLMLTVCMVLTSSTPAVTTVSIWLYTPWRSPNFLRRCLILTVATRQLVTYFKWNKMLFFSSKKLFTRIYYVDLLLPLLPGRVLLSEIKGMNDDFCAFIVALKY